jgi:Tfp pilus assembly protein PilO
MKTWGIIATILLVVLIGVSGWFYMQNKNLKDQKNKAETELSAAQSKNTQDLAVLNNKIAAAGKKITVIKMMTEGINSQDASLEVYSLIKEMNNETLTADWKAMQTSKPGDNNNTGQNLMIDLLSAASNDLK